MAFALSPFVSFNSQGSTDHKAGFKLAIMVIDTTSEVRAIARYIRMSPSKVRRVLDQIRGKSYRDALILLEFMPYRSCQPILKVLRSAVANAENNEGLDPTRLVVSQAFADQGPVLKRFRPRAQGRAYRRHRPTCHITVVVAPRVEED
jgi:large subunit ribosomal protein L22